MKSSAMIPLVVLLVAHSAQAAEMSDPTDPPVSHFQGSCDGDPDGTKFAKRACYTSFDPNRAAFGPAYRPPTCAKKEVSELQRDLLAKAYSRAPDYVKAKLCRLTKVFVAQSTRRPWGSWGLWEGPDRRPGTGVYVAISERELGPESKKSLAEAENEIVDGLLGGAVGGHKYRSRLERLQTSDDPDRELTVLAALAHELGHALLADSNADGTDRRHPRRRFSGPPKSACFEDAFLGSSWEVEKFHEHMHRWVEFGNQYENRARNPEFRFSLKQLRAAAHQGKFDAANSLIEKVYRGTEFVSFNALINPLEDFSDTYKYQVLADAKRTQPIIIRLRDNEINVLDFLKSEIIAKKVGCLRDLGFLTSQP
ncbi:MAG TPA: hypothetical protein VF478_04755 [Anaerolineae bacterium]